MTEDADGCDRLQPIPCALHAVMGPHSFYERSNHAKRITKARSSQKYAGTVHVLLLTRSTVSLLKKPKLGQKNHRENPARNEVVTERVPLPELELERTGAARLRTPRGSYRIGAPLTNRTSRRFLAVVLTGYH